MDLQGQGQEQFLVGGAITIWKNMSSSMGRMTTHIIIMENKTCLKPPTSNKHGILVSLVRHSGLTWFNMV